LPFPLLAGTLTTNIEDSCHFLQPMIAFKPPKCLAVLENALDEALEGKYSQSYITTDNQSVSPSWWQAPIWDLPQIFSILSLTRSRVCSDQFLPGIASAAFLRSESHGTHEHSLLSIFF
jgi:hypothetical protein